MGVFRSRLVVVCIATTTVLIGASVGSGAPSVSAIAPPLPDTCAAYIQGPIDPTGGMLPAAFPFNSGDPHTFYAVGHDTKGQDKTLVDLNNTSAGATRFRYGVTMTNLNGGAAITIKYQWKNGAAATIHTEPTVKVADRAPIAAGVITGVPGPDRMGPQIGNISQVPPVYRLVVPKAATSGGYHLSFTILRNAIAPGVPPAAIPVSIPLPYNASAAAIQLAYNLYAGASLSASSVTGTDFVSGSTDGVYTFTGGESFAGGMPVLNVDTVTGDLATTKLDDGSIWNGASLGGIDPSIVPITALPQGAFAASGTMTSGPVGPSNGTRGKAQFVPDTQMMLVGYPAAFVTGTAPRIGTTDPAIVATMTNLAVMAGSTLAATNDVCGLGGLIAVLCIDEPAKLPATIATFCPSILG